MRASSKRLSAIFISFLLLIGTAVVYSQFIRPAYNEIQKLRGEIQTRKDLLKTQESAVEQIKNLISQFQSLTHLQETISLSLPLKPDNSQLLGQYQTISRISGANIQSIKLNIPSIKPAGGNKHFVKGRGVLRFDLKVLGSYEAVKEFVQAIETNIRITDLASMKISPIGKPEQNLFSNEIVVDNYYQSD